MEGQRAGPCAKFRGWTEDCVLLSAIAGLSGALVGAALLKRERRTAGRPSGRPWPANFAHRGAAARAPENTLEAFRLAVEAGAGGLELDVHLTRDGEVVVIHDATVDRVTDGSGAVAGMTLEEVRRLDAGNSFSPDGGQTFPYRGRGVRISTLAEVYEEFPDILRERRYQGGATGGREGGAQGHPERSRRRTDPRRLHRPRSAAEVPQGLGRPYLHGGFEARDRRVLRAEQATSRGAPHPAYEALQVPVEHRGIKLVTPRFLKCGPLQGGAS